MFVRGQGALKMHNIFMKINMNQYRPILFIDFLDISESNRNLYSNTQRLFKFKLAGLNSFSNPITSIRVQKKQQQRLLLCRVKERLELLIRFLLDEKKKDREDQDSYIVAYFGQIIRSICDRCFVYTPNPQFLRTFGGFWLFKSILILLRITILKRIL